MSESNSAAGGRDRPAIVVGFLMLALAGILWSDAIGIARQVNYGVGPAVMPKIIATALVIFGGLSILSGFRNAGTEPEEAEFGPVFLLIVGFLILTALIGFGGGMHRCAGVNFARMEMKVLVAVLLQHYDMELIDPVRPIAGAGTYWPAQPCRVRYRKRDRGNAQAIDPAELARAAGCPAHS